MTSLSFREALRALPKAELHVHLDGCVRPATLADLAWLHRTSLRGKSATEISSLLSWGEPAGSLPSYLDRFTEPLNVLQDAPSLRRVSFELIEDCAWDGCHHVEVRFCPAFHTRGGLTLQSVIAAVADGLDEGERRYGVSSVIIASLLRNRGLEEADSLVSLALEHARIAAVDLAGPEEDHPAADFGAVFQRARRAGLHRTVHAGEVVGPESIATAIDSCAAQRIGHGVSLGRDRELLSRVRAEGIPLEMCPTSNVQTTAVSGYDTHPALDYLRGGIAVTINTDSRSISGTTLIEEFEHLARLGASFDEMAQLCRNSLEVAFVEADVRATLLKRYDTVFARVMPLVGPIEFNEA